MLYYRARVRLLAKLMALQEHTPRTLAARTGYSHVTIWAISTGRKRCREDLATQMARELGVSMDDLFQATRLRETA